MRRKIVAGNWKMNLLKNDRDDLLKELKGINSNDLKCELIVCPAYVYLENVKEELNQIQVGAQNVSENNNGAYTGEVSAEMLSHLGVNFVIIGHSERRAFFGDSEDVVAKKMLKAFEFGLEPILCCGETLGERERGLEKQVVSRQLQSALSGVSVENLTKLVVAYEPVWAIGTGKTASSEQAQEMHQFIRTLLQELFGDKGASVPVLYGGSCKPENAQELFACPDIDGGLIGGASLKAESFIAIAKSF